MEVQNGRSGRNDAGRRKRDRLLRLLGRHEYAVNAVNGRLIWKQYLGVEIANPICDPPKIGVSSPATVLNGTVYVGGPDGYGYALNARTGAVEWRVWTYGSDTPGVY